MRNKKFVLHKALLDAYYTLFLKRQKLDGYLEELDINIDLDECRAYYNKLRYKSKNLEEAFASLHDLEKEYKEAEKKRKIKGSKEDRKHGLFKIYFCEYAIIEEGIMSICEELDVSYNKVKNELYRITQMYHNMSAYDLAHPHDAVVSILPFMKDVCGKQWFKKAFSVNAKNIIEAVIKNNSDNIIEDKYIVNKIIW